MIIDNGVERVPFAEHLVVLGHVGESGYAARLASEVKTLKTILAGYYAKKALDVGCGYGRLAPWIAEVSDEYYGVDAEEKLVELARKNHPTLNFQRALIQRLPFPDNMFDLCVSWTVLQHIPGSAIEKAASEILRVLQPKCVLVIGESIRDDESHTNFEYPRSLSHYKELFKPLNLVSPILTRSAGKVLRFEGTGE